MKQAVTKSRKELEKEREIALRLRRKAALIALGRPDAGGRRGLVYTSTAADLLGVTPQAVKDLLEPADHVRNPHFRSGPLAALFDPVVILEIRDTAAVANARAQRGRKPKNYVTLFEKRYSHPARAIGDAAKMMWNLNRYAKHRRCSASHRAEIYLLKNRLVNYLAEAGCLTGYAVHRVTKPARRLECRGCLGEGCDRCEFTGMYRELDERELSFVVLRFSIDGETYTWHQPEKDLTWTLPEDTPTIADSAQWTPASAPKPIEISPARLAEAKALVRWVMQDVDR